MYLVTEEDNSRCRVMPSPYMSTGMSNQYHSCSEVAVLHNYNTKL
jgi:hypothetical protein